jgi:hypothetical protein
MFYRRLRRTVKAKMDHAGELLPRDAIKAIMVDVRILNREETLDGL